MTTATDRPTQTQQLLELLLRRGYRGVTPTDALEVIGSFRLAARVWDLRHAGHDVRRDMIRLPNGKSVARYTLIAPPPEPEQMGLSL